MERKSETAAVKKALIGAGFDQNNVRVHHGKGTAWGWINVSLDIKRSPSCYCGEPDDYGRRETCADCREYWRDIHNRIISVVRETTGRHGEYDGRTSIDLSFSN
jgi:hypothetical protein